MVLDFEQVGMRQKPRRGGRVSLQPSMRDEDRGGNAVGDQLVQDALINVPGTGIESECHGMTASWKRQAWLDVAGNGGRGKQGEE